MDRYEIIKTIKKKLFEPKKTIDIDELGHKTIVNKKNWADNKNLEEEEQELLDLCDGWDLVDKSFLEKRITDIIQKVSSLPSAPLYPLNNNVYKSILFSCGELVGDKIIFFNHGGILLKKDWKIVEICILPETAIEDEVPLHLTNFTDKKSKQITKIKKSGKSAIVADSSITIDSSIAVTFDLHLTKKAEILCNIQLTIEHF